MSHCNMVRVRLFFLPNLIFNSWLRSIHDFCACRLSVQLAATQMKWSISINKIRYHWLDSFLWKVFGIHGRPLLISNRCVVGFFYELWQSFMLNFNAENENAVVNMKSTMKPPISSQCDYFLCWIPLMIALFFLFFNNGNSYRNRMHFMVQQRMCSHSLSHPLFFSLESLVGSFEQ